MGLVDGKIKTSVVNPITLNLDPDPEFWAYLDLYPTSRMVMHLFLKYKKKMLPEEIFSQLSL